MNRTNPCYGCESRTADCHSKCEAYCKWKAERNAVKAEQTAKAAELYRYKSYRQSVYDRNEKIRSKLKSER